MQVVKRTERSYTLPSRRSGSSLEFMRPPSQEHLIFGEASEKAEENVITSRDGVLEAFGERAPEPSSPSRPPSIRRRQSLKLMDLEQRLENIGAENATLIQDKANLEKNLAEHKAYHKKSKAISNLKLATAHKTLEDKTNEIEELKKQIAWYQSEVQSLSTSNDDLKQDVNRLHANVVELGESYERKFSLLNEKLDEKTEELLRLTSEHRSLQTRTSSESLVAASHAQKDAEISLLRAELSKAREDVRGLEHKIMSRQSNRYLDIKSTSHFASSAQSLFEEVLQWCTDFSSFSAGRRCVHVHRITDEKVKDRFEQIMLDDRGVRRMLKDKDETRRILPLTAIMMRLIWEFVFTRYLFGLETEERQKLLQLERMLYEATESREGAVHQWRATTLTLLSQRETFRSRLTHEIENVLSDIMKHLNYLLPPPPQHMPTALSSLRSLLKRAVTLAIEMRTQRAEYVMVRAPLPEYNDAGEVANLVPFKAEQMCCYGGDGLMSDYDLERDQAHVKLVLFPRIVRRGNEYGEEYDSEIVVSKMVCLVNRKELRSESRASLRSVSSVSGMSQMSGMSGMSGMSQGWREELGKQQVQRLTPITDHSPRSTSPDMKNQGAESASILSIIPEQTIRLVHSDMEVDEEEQGHKNMEKKRRVEY
jgi:predicted  nucleic acid-binding Zn-ribbon protein